MFLNVKLFGVEEIMDGGDIRFDQTLDNIFRIVVAQNFAE